MRFSQLPRAADHLAGACMRQRPLQLRAQNQSALRAQDAAPYSVPTAKFRATERQHASTPTSTKMISAEHSNSEGTSCRDEAQLNSSRSSWQTEQPVQESASESLSQRRNRREAAPARLWCWEWGNMRWRASFFFLLASVAFVIGSAASLHPQTLAGKKALASLYLEPFALGSLWYLTGARLYKRAALEGYASQRRTLGRLAPALKWARVEVAGTGMIVLGCELGSISSCAPLLLQAFPGTFSYTILAVLEAWLSTALNTVAGGLFVVGSYTILAGMYHSFSPRRVLVGPHVGTLNFWGSAAYLVGSCGLLIGAVFAQPLFAVHPLIKYWLGQVVGYLTGSLWFVLGATAQIRDIARELSARTGKPL